MLALFPSWFGPLISISNQSICRVNIWRIDISFEVHDLSWAINLPLIHYNFLSGFQPFPRHTYDKHDSFFLYFLSFIHISLFTSDCPRLALSTTHKMYSWSLGSQMYCWLLGYKIFGNSTIKWIASHFVLEWHCW